MRMRALHATDFYKTGHRRQYPDHTELVYSNLTCRSDHHAVVLPDFDHRTVFFGMQGLIKWLLIDLWGESFFDQDREAVAGEYHRRVSGALGDPGFSVEHVCDLHCLGYLPVEIKALPEGSRVNIKVPPFTIRNTHGEHFAWVTNYLETQLSAEIWKPITSATSAYEFRRLLDRYAAETGSPAAFVPWQGHDFSFRGMSGIYDAATSGAAHLTSFLGTDTIVAIDYVEDYYGGKTTFVGGSVPATEHSVMCMGGKDDELGTFRRLITEVHPTGVVSIVSDTWDFWHVVTQTARRLRLAILERRGKVVFRPDSGSPVKIIVGDPDAPAGSPARKGAVQCLWELFSGTTTPTGHRLLDEHVGLIYGDGITLEIAQAILAGLEAKGFASGNIVFGVGSFTYQYTTRDSFGSAMKATYGVVDGVGREIFKDPKTDSGLKKSAKGLLRVEEGPGGFVLHDRQTEGQEAMGALRRVFLDGRLYNEETIEQIRDRLHGGRFLG